SARSWARNGSCSKSWSTTCQPPLGSPKQIFLVCLTCGCQSEWWPECQLTQIRIFPCLLDFPTLPMLTSRVGVPAPGRMAVYRNGRYALPTVSRVPKLSATPGTVRGTHEQEAKHSSPSPCRQGRQPGTS